ncbi:Caspase domain-containing protein [Haloechinothrix alba]|uniref:Caspase domain-containing protein n=1 Tax=Haloechinothrix alba TaxID=664784 RepID=A0A238YTU4_9PSEU|nr:caspase family protein [Haloechinothrix alba]SNR74074.1 Caspase domain-containing protein [Haloechinothrix alba]
MIRAGVFIGVDRSGDLTPLRDAAAGAAAMHEWALSQGMGADRAKLITDADGREVTPELIYDAVTELIGGAGVDQLVVYSAGHGVNINRCEHWLLTEAPVRTSAAVNVTGSAELARYCGIPHVVIISDACRVAPEGIRAQNVRGQDVFPNEGLSDRPGLVDQFFACFLGRTAAEIKAPEAAAGAYKALYTQALLEALAGSCPDVLEDLRDAADPALYVRPRPLQAYLEEEVPRRILERQLAGKVNQSPDAIITSYEDWVSRVERGTRPEGTRADASSGAEPDPRTRRAVSPERREHIAGGIVTAATAGSWMPSGHDPEGVGGPEGAVGAAAPDDGEPAPAEEGVSAVFGPDYFTSGCGIKVRGATVAEVVAASADAEILDDRQTVRVERLDAGEPASVLVRSDNGTGAVVAALPDFVAALTVDGDELVDVAYEPSSNTARWERYARRASDIRALRAAAASASLHGRFRPDSDDAARIAERMRVAGEIDPALSVYAAYAMHDLGDIERIGEMSADMRHSHRGFTLFDLALLEWSLTDNPLGARKRVVPCVPLLAQGWALLNAHRLWLPRALAGLDTDVRESLWTLFGPAGVDKLRTALRNEELR